jgi:hypothetical protein
MVKPLGKELYITKELLEIVMYAKTKKKKKITIYIFFLVKRVVYVNLKFTSLFSLK